ncbi:MAG: nitroreductase family protein [Oscillospiraceae bacterium]|nr:nitroreductase family protein [Oscillospiraceae bacterium]
MDFLELAAKRYSVRSFKETPVPQMMIDQILMAGCAAPTAHNNQPQRILVIHSQEGISTLKKCTECHYNAPLAFIVCYDKETCWKRSYDDKTSGDIDASIAAVHMMMEATELGIGSAWIMHFIPEAVKVEFELPENIEPVAILVMGYADSGPSQEHFRRRDLNDLVSYR